MKLIDKTSGSGSIHEIQPGIVYKRFKRNFQRVNDTYGLFNITIHSAQSDDCFREFEILVKSPFNENDKRVTELVILPCEKTVFFPPKIIVKRPLPKIETGQTLNIEVIIRANPFNEDKEAKPITDEVR